MHYAGVFGRKRVLSEFGCNACKLSHVTLVRVHCYEPMIAVKFSEAHPQSLNTHFNGSLADSEY